METNSVPGTFRRSKVRFWFSAFLEIKFPIMDCCFKNMFSQFADQRHPPKDSRMISETQAKKKVKSLILSERSDNH